MTKLGAVAQKKTIRIDKIRQAIADCIGSEGCGCCEGPDHEGHQGLIAKMLNVPRYSDDSGWDFGQFETTKGD